MLHGNLLLGRYMHTGCSPGVVITAAMGNPLPIPLAMVTVDAGESEGRYMYGAYIHVHMYIQ